MQLVTNFEQTQHDFYNKNLKFVSRTMQLFTTIQVLWATYHMVISLLKVTRQTHTKTEFT